MIQCYDVCIGQGVGNPCEVPEKKFRGSRPITRLELAPRDFKIGKRCLDMSGSSYAISGEFCIDDTDPATNIEKLFVLQGAAPELREHEPCDSVRPASPVTSQVALRHLWTKLALRRATVAHFSSILQ